MDWYSQFSGTSTQDTWDPYSFRNTQLDTLVMDEQRERTAYRRGFWDRVFAPLEAPQQALYSFTKGVAEDGFQLHDVGTALGHGFRYANPWSNNERIYATELFDTVFGPTREKSLGRQAGELLTTVFFDPLFFVPAGKALGVIQKGGSYDAAMAAVRGGVKGAAAKATETVGTTLLGANRWADLKYTMGRYFVSKYYGLPEEFQKQVMAFQQEAQGYRVEAASILRRAQGMGTGPEVHELMSRALTNEMVGKAFHTAASADEAKAAVQGLSEWRSIINQVERTGTNPELFYEIYSRSRNLETRIGYNLMKRGVIPVEEWTELQYNHLRVMYEAYENPTNYINRLNDIADTIPDVLGARLRYDTTKAGGVRRAIDPVMRPIVSALNKDLRAASRIEMKQVARLTQQMKDAPAPQLLDNLFAEAASNPAVRAELEDVLTNVYGRGLTQSFERRYLEQVDLARRQVPEFGERVNEYLRTHNVADLDELWKSTQANPTFAQRQRELREAVEQVNANRTLSLPEKQERIAALQRRFEQTTGPNLDVLVREAQAELARAGRKTGSGLNRRVAKASEQMGTVSAPPFQADELTRRLNQVYSNPSQPDLDEMFRLASIGADSTVPPKVEQALQVNSVLDDIAQSLGGTSWDTLLERARTGVAGSPTALDDAVAAELRRSPMDPRSRAATARASGDALDDAIRGVQQPVVESDDFRRLFGEVENVPTPGAARRAALDARMDEAFPGPLDARYRRASNRPTPDLDALYREQQAVELARSGQDLGATLQNRAAQLAGDVGTPARNLDSLFNNVEEAERLKNFLVQHFDSFTTNPYVRTQKNGVAKFNYKAFIDDLNKWTKENYSATIEDVLEHVQRDMMKGFETSPELMEAVANAVMGSVDMTVTRHGARHYADRLLAMQTAPNFGFKRFKEHLEIVSKRKDIPDEIRELLGEYKDFGRRLAADATEGGQLAALRGFFDQILGVERTGDGVVSAVRGTGFVSPNRADIAGQAVPVNPALFGLSEKNVPELFANPRVAKFLQSTDGMAHSYNETKRFWERIGDAVARGTSQFKMFKVVLDPAAHARNIFGNMVLTDMAGVNPFNMQRAGVAMDEILQYHRDGTMGRYLRLAQEAGVEALYNTFTASEMQTIAGDLVGIAQSLSPVKKAENWLQAVANATKRAGRNYSQRMATAFQGEETFFKLNVFIKEYDEAVTALAKAGREVTPEMSLNIARQAGELADRALFNYGDVPIFVEFARKYGIVPFITFPYKAGIRTAEVLTTAPHRVVKYQRIADGVNYMYDPTPQQVQAEIEALPQHLRENMVVRMPFTDQQGRPLYMDLSYVLPWQTILEVSESFGSMWEEGAVLPRDGMFTPPLMALYNLFTRGEDSLGRKVTDESKTPFENITAMVQAAAQTVLPGWTPGIGSRSMSLARATEALIRTSPEPLPGASVMRRVLDPFGGQERAVNRYGMTPQTQAQVQVAGVNPNISPFFGTIQSMLLGTPLTASDPAQSIVNETARHAARESDLRAQISRVKNNPNLSLQEKMERVERLYRGIEEESNELMDWFSRLGA